MKSNCNIIGGDARVLGSNGTGYSRSEIYAGLAWQHEFGSKAEATLHAGMYSFTAPAPSMEGETGIAELGIKLRSSSGHFETNLGLTGAFGKQSGVGFNAQFQWNF